jgi:hypothetical protein
LEIQEGEKRIAQLRTQVIHLDATLRILRPDYNPEALPTRHRRRTKSPYFEHGELTSRIYDVLREHRVTSSADVAVRAMKEKGLDPNHDQPIRKDFVRRVTLQMRELAAKGIVERMGGRGPASRWQLRHPR